MSTSSSRRAASVFGAHGFALPPDYVPPTQPPSARSPDVRKSQLLRSYTSLIRSTPLFLVFQHSNLTGEEWVAVRRELGLAIAKVASPGGAAAPSEVTKEQAEVVPAMSLQVIRGKIFLVALRIVEFFDGGSAVAAGAGAKPYTHDLSNTAYAAMRKTAIDTADLPETSIYAQLKPLLMGPLALLKFPAISPAHLAAALSILSPSPQFPAPKRRNSPGYYDPVFQSGLKKLLLVGGRIENRVFDVGGVQWVGGLGGDLDVLRAQLVALLQSAGLGLTSALECAGNSLWLTMESRKAMLEEPERAVEEGESS